MRFKIFIFLLTAFCSLQTGKAQPWYHQTTIYQIYPRSYYDSNDDGIGDIQGIIQKLDYIKALGFETIWCSPFFSSPQKDFGYDISDYENIAPEYGTLEDAQQLISEVHKRGMKIVFDMVMNHTSDQHPWFKESASSKTNPKADWYLWRDKPNKWKSALLQKGWHYVKERDQYYWASFLPFQPDLNYRNPEVKKAMFGSVRFWLQKGVDGFRLDMFNSIYKDSLYRNNAASRKAVMQKHDAKDYKKTVKGYMNQPESFGFAKELRAVCDEFGDKMLLGEVFGNHAMIRRFVGEEKNDGLGLAFDFEMLRFKFKAKYFHELIESLEKDFPEPFAPVYVFSNHDRRRMARRLKGNIEKAKLIHLLQFTTRGVPCFYYGEEIGMTDSRMPYRKALDPVAHLRPGLPRFLVDMVGETMNRDELRTPMQWDSTKNAGFSSAEKTWLPVSENYETVNVSVEEKKENSMLNFITSLVDTRNKHAALAYGNLELIPAKELPRNMLGYYRNNENEKLLVLINFSKRKKKISLKENMKTVLFSSQKNLTSLNDNQIILDGHSGAVLAH